MDKWFFSFCFTATRSDKNWLPTQRTVTSDRQREIVWCSRLQSISTILEHVALQPCWKCVCYYSHCHKRETTVDAAAPASSRVSPFLTILRLLSFSGSNQLGFTNGCKDALIACQASRRWAAGEEIKGNSSTKSILSWRCGSSSAFTHVQFVQSEQLICILCFPFAHRLSFKLIERLFVNTLPYYIQNWWSWGTLAGRPWEMQFLFSPLEGGIKTVIRHDMIVFVWHLTKRLFLHTRFLKTHPGTEDGRRP